MLIVLLEVGQCSVAD